MRQPSTRRHLLRRVFYILIVGLFVYSSAYAENIIDGYRGARWGMTVSEVREVIKNSGLEYADWGQFIVKDKMFGSDAEIRYLVGNNLPLEMVMVKIEKPVTGQVPYGEIKSALEQKYGTPLKKMTGHENNKLEMWTTSQTGIRFMLDDSGDFAVIIYLDLNAEKKYY